MLSRFLAEGDGRDRSTAGRTPRFRPAESIQVYLKVKAEPAHYRLKYGRSKERPGRPGRPTYRSKRVVAKAFGPLRLTRLSD
jgi:hypothetical protein